MLGWVRVLMIKVVVVWIFLELFVNFFFRNVDEFFVWVVSSVDFVI